MTVTVIHKCGYTVECKIEFSFDANLTGTMTNNHGWKNNLKNAGAYKNSL
jgi:hypothetical protein